jgi:nucleotide-binding universal stress UspA family protein
MRPVNSTYDVRRILCAVDHSEPSLRAADFAMNLAGKCRAELLLLSVVCLPDTTEEDITEYLRHEHNTDPLGVVVEEAARDELSLLRDRIARQCDVAITCKIRAGKAATEIVSLAKEHAIDLIVVGHRSHKRLVGVLLGSVARTVVETAHCPVLVVR